MTAIDTIGPLVEHLREGFRSGVLRSVDDRRTQLEQLRRFLVQEERAILGALAADLGKPSIEAYSTEIGFTINEIDHTLKHLDRWTSSTKVRVPLTFRPATARIVPEPLGTVLVIAPWNYPLQLLLAPLVPALAAGNTVVLKPSEVAPATSALVEAALPRYLDERAVGVVTGGVEETTALLDERFDHIFYTGNGTVGRVVMRAAAEHLTPVTLELGGKSPAIVTADADIEVTARRIAWGKFVNAGQTCVAPDYVLVDASVEDELLRALRVAIESSYGGDPSRSADYCRIVNERHHDRLTALLDAGGFDRAVVGGASDRSTRYLAPTVLAGVKPDAQVMSDEIFGPILPVLSVADVDEAVRFVNDRPKPLALYLFTRDRSTADRVIRRTSAGGVTVNHTLLHLALADLPFGGVGESGMGAYHGKAGFDVFSHAKPVLHKRTRPDPSIMYPPYTRWKQRILRRVL
jgi:aldehyde dehydrogenase (NAD+)